MDLPDACKLCNVYSFKSEEEKFLHNKSNNHCKKYILEEYRLGHELFKQHYQEAVFAKMPELLASKRGQFTSPVLEFVFRCGITLDFKCALCNNNLTDGSWIPHLKGIKHAMAYVKFTSERSLQDFMMSFPCLPGAADDKVEAAKEKLRAQEEFLKQKELDKQHQEQLQKLEELEQMTPRQQQQQHLRDQQEKLRNILNKQYQPKQQPPKPQQMQQQQQQQQRQQQQQPQQQRQQQQHPQHQRQQQQQPKQTQQQKGFNSPPMQPGKVGLKGAPGNMRRVDNVPFARPSGSKDNVPYARPSGSKDNVPYARPSGSKDNVPYARPSGSKDIDPYAHLPSQSDDYGRDKYYDYYQDEAERRFQKDRPQAARSDNYNNDGFNRGPAPKDRPQASIADDFNNDRYNRGPAQMSRQDQAYQESLKWERERQERETRLRKEREERARLQEALERERLLEERRRAEENAAMEAQVRRMREEKAARARQLQQELEDYNAQIQQQEVLLQKKLEEKLREKEQQDMQQMQIEKLLEEQRRAQQEQFQRVMEEQERRNHELESQLHMLKDQLSSQQIAMQVPELRSNDAVGVQEQVSEMQTMLKDLESTQDMYQSSLKMVSEQQEKLKELNKIKNQQDRMEHEVRKRPSSHMDDHDHQRRRQRLDEDRNRDQDRSSHRPDDSEVTRRAMEGVLGEGIGQLLQSQRDIVEHPEERQTWGEGGDQTWGQARGAMEVPLNPQGQQFGSFNMGGASMEGPIGGSLVGPPMHDPSMGGPSMGAQMNWQMGVSTSAETGDPIAVAAMTGQVQVKTTPDGEREVTIPLGPRSKHSDKPQYATAEIRNKKMSENKFSRYMAYKDRAMGKKAEKKAMNEGLANEYNKQQMAEAMKILNQTVCQYITVLTKNQGAANSLVDPAFCRQLEATISQLTASTTEADPAENMKGLQSMLTALTQLDPSILSSAMQSEPSLQGLDLNVLIQSMSMLQNQMP